MAENTFESLLAQLNDLLDRERAALLAGKLLSLSDFLAEKERLIAALEDCDFKDRDSLSATQKIFDRNKSLISGAMNGVQEVSSRMKAIRKARGGLETYDQSGLRTRYATLTPGKVERRS